ncbi:MAG: hypothetical protein AB1489_33925 [Acidobacteriota bacterium]
MTKNILMALITSPTIAFNSASTYQPSFMPQAKATTMFTLRIVTTYMVESRKLCWIKDTLLRFHIWVGGLFDLPDLPEPDVSADEDNNQPDSNEQPAKTRSNAKSGDPETDRETGHRQSKDSRSQQSVRQPYGDSHKIKPLSRFSLEDCLEFARAEAKHNPNITNPIGLSKWPWRSGEQDHLIQAWKDNPEEMIAIWESGMGFSACDTRTGG